jgi:hypothetical protein
MSASRVNSPPMSLKGLHRHHEGWGLAGSVIVPADCSSTLLMRSTAAPMHDVAATAVDIENRGSRPFGRTRQTSSQGKAKLSHRCSVLRGRGSFVICSDDHAMARGTYRRRVALAHALQSATTRCALAGQRARTVHVCVTARPPHNYLYGRASLELNSFWTTVRAAHFRPTGNKRAPSMAARIRAQQQTRRRSRMQRCGALGVALQMP